MANVKLLFYGTEKSETENVTIECFYNAGCELSVVISEGNYSPKHFIVLDKSTAIRFSKELRKQIALLDQL